MNRPNKRKLPPIAYNEQIDSDSEWSNDDDGTTYSDSSSDDESDDEAINPGETEDVTNLEEVIWKNVPTAYSPRMVVPEYKEPETELDGNFTNTEVFFKLFPQSLFIWIADCTNKRLNILSEKKGKVVKPTDASEIMVVIGCLLVMSYNRVPHIYMYWSNNQSVRNETIATAISRDRFMLLHSKLYFNEPKKPNGAGKTYYMTEMMSCLIYTFNRYRSEGTYQSIDEFMVKFDGRTSMKQYQPIKPVKVGVKGYCRADASTGYVYDMFIYKGKETETLEGTLGERVVTTLCRTIRENNVAIIMDRFFTSVRLLQNLNYASVGTVMSNRKYLPVMTGKIKRGQSMVKCTDGGTICYKWQDVKEVMLLSNCHGHKIGVANRRQKDGVLKEFDCPEAIIFYNKFMAGVDKADQYSTCYEIDRKTNKWWKRVFYRLLLIAVSNSWILFKKFQTKDLPLIKYLMPLSENLIEVGNRSAKNQKKKATGPPSKRLKLMTDIGHQPLRHAARRRCTFCASKNKQSRTYYICSTCDIPLCVDCFAPYHGNKL